MPSSLIRLLALCLSTFCALTLAAQEGSQGATSPDLSQKGNCKLEGRVVSAVGETPVRKANVMINSDSEGQQKQDFTVTDAEGRFSFTELQAGKYHLFVSHPSYVPTVRRTRDSATNYTLLPGQEIKDAVIRLLPGAVLKGHVTDEDGDPVSYSSVELIPAIKKSPYGNLIRGRFDGNRATNDLGEFRMFGVPPGRYYIRANPGAGSGIGSSRSKAHQNAYVPTFYPSAIGRDAAALLDLRGGEEITVNIVLQRTAVYLISGILRSAKGPVESGMISVSQGTNHFGTTSVQEGKFELRLPPGHYTLTGIDEGSVFTGNSEEQQQVSRGIDVSEGGLRNLELFVGPESGQSAPVSGRIRAEAGASLPKNTMMFLVLQPFGAWMEQRNDDEDPYVRGNGVQTTVSKPDGSFEFKNVPFGTYELTINSNSSGVEDWYTKAVYAGNHDVLNSGIRVSNTDVELDVLLSAKGGSAEGVVKDNEQRPATDATVVLVPDAPRAKRQDLYQTANTDQSGHFLIRGLEPGSYRAYAFEDDEAGVWFNPEEMKQYNDDGVPLMVSAAEKSHAELHLATSHQQQETQ